MSALRAVVANPLSDGDLDLLRRLEPRLEVVHDATLTGPASDDWMARWQRPAELQSAYEEYIDSADVLYGVPDQSGRALARTVAANPGLRWVHTIPAGGGQQVRAAHLDRAELDRILFTTSAGVHAEPLSEFALFGVLAGAKLLPWLLEAQRRHEWAPRRVMPVASDLTVAIVGLGSIARVLAAKLAGLGYTVVGVHRREVDVPGISEVYGVDRLAEVAALDVTYSEPLAPDSPLWDLPNVLIAPHTAAISPHESRKITELFAENARRLLDGEELLHRVDTVEFY
jgi:phosphoglycerate dehydrogenase-like enzyme